MRPVAIVAEEHHEDIFFRIIDQNMVETVPQPAMVDEFAIRPIFQMPSIAILLGRYFIVLELVLCGGGLLHHLFG